eukprot:1146041-Pelagomonas_calceolata.AAC.20
MARYLDAVAAALLGQAASLHVKQTRIVTNSDADGVRGGALEALPVTSLAQTHMRACARARAHNTHTEQMHTDTVQKHMSPTHRPPPVACSRPCGRLWVHCCGCCRCCAAGCCPGREVL